MHSTLVTLFLYEEMYNTMSKLYSVLFILQVAHVYCLRGYNSVRGPFTAFIPPSTVPSVVKNEQRTSMELSAEAVSSSHESLPYSSGVYPTLKPGDLKFMGQTLEGEFKPSNNFVLIQKHLMHEYSAGGIYIGSKANKEFAGRVLAVGPGKVAPLTGALIPVTVKVGDVVLYDPPEEQPVITYKNQECVLVPEDQIYARMEFNQSGSTKLDPSEIRPLSDRILVRIIDSPKKTQSGLVLAQSQDIHGTIYRASVVCIGPGAYREDGTFVPLVDFQPGDTVLFSDTAADGGEFNVNKAQHAFVRREAVLAKI